MKRRILSIITALALCLSLCPTWALAVEADPSLCKHHPEHTEDCGYAAPTEGHGCGHRHTAECYTLGVLPDADSGDPYEVGADTENLLDCQHSHDSECGYVQADPGASCGYVCHICPIEDLIAALPEQVTEDNRADVRGQLGEILALYRELDENEQGQIDLSRVTALQEALDAANAPVAAAETINVTNGGYVTLTAEDGGCQGHTFTGTVQAATLYVESGAHDVTFSGLNITDSAVVGIAPGVTMNLTIEGTNTIKSDYNAGIYVPENATLVITAESTGTLDVSSSTDAGIGGGAFDPSDPTGYTSGDPNCGTVVINGGTVTATGGRMCAGIGGGMSAKYSPGNGGTVTISGGTVTAAGGSDGTYGGAGIGGSAGETASSRAGNGGTLTISGGHVTLNAGAHDTQWSTAYGFGQGSGSAPAGGTCELTLADASCLTVDSLDPKGKYTINGDPTEDMIVVPEDLVYNGKAQELDGKIYIDDTKTGTGTYFNQTFTVNASADGWTYTIDPAEVKAAGDYTVTFSKEGHTSISKTFTVAQSGTQFVEDGEVKTFNGETQTDTFTAGDTITVKATPTPTGAAPDNSAMFAASFTPPGAGQMAVFVGDTQVSEPVGVGEDGTYTMEVSAADVLLAAGGPGTEIPLTAKFIENTSMADGAGTVKVNITAVAKAEKDGKVIGYYGESNLDKAFANDGATVTLLDNITTSMHVGVDTGNLTLDLNGKTITKPASYGLYVSGSGHLTIRGNGKVICTGTSGHYPEAITSLGGTLTLESGTFIGIMYGVHARGETSVLSVTGESVSIQCEGRGLYISQAQSVELSAGTYSSISVYTFNTLASLLAENCAYYKGSTPVLLSELEGKTELTGPVTVQACTHAYQYAHTPGTTTHSQTCPACGDAKASEKCDFSNGPCPCGAVLAVTLPADLNLTYNGTAQEPGVTVTVDGTTTLTKDTDYSVAYENNTAAGENTAKVTVTGTTFTGTATLNFSISKATPTITWSSATQELTFTGQQAVITAPTVTLVNNESFGGTIHYSYTGTTSGTGLPTNAGTYTIMAHVDAEGNYNAADSSEMTLTIKQARVTITWDSTMQAVTYTGKTAEITAPTITAEGGVAVSVTPTYSYHQEEGEPGYRDGLPTNAGTYSIVASIKESGNLTAARADMMLIINKAPLTITGATVASKPYDGTDTAIVSGVTFTGLVNGETLALGADYTATGKFDSVSAGTGKNVTVTVTLTSDKAKNYSLAQNTTTATGTINRASSSITTAPTASGITYGQALSGSTLTGGGAVSGDTTIAGTWNWTAPDTKPNAGTAQYEVMFTPSDTNYDTATVNVTVTVAKATPTLTAPTAGAIQYGQKLSDSTLTGGTATNPNGSAAVDGTWSWASGNTRPTADGDFPVSFVPGDTANYNTPGNVDASVTVSAAAPKITLTVPAYQVANGVVEVKYTAANPHDATLNDLPAVTLTYKVGSGAEQPITDGKFTIPEGTAVDTVITVTASTAAVDGKYTAATKTATVTVTDKIPVEISGVGVTGRAYNGKAIDHTGTPVIKTLDGKTVTDATVTYTWSSGGDTGPINAGNYTLTISVDGEKYIGSTTVDFTIEKATVTITAANKSAVVGSAQPELTYTVSGLANGETLDTVPTLTCTPDMNTVGSYPITASGAAVPNTGNYNTTITYVDGTLSVTAKPSTGGGDYVPSNPGGSTLPVTTTGQGSTTTTTTTTAAPTASVSNGTATTTINTAMGQEIVRQATANKSENVVIAPSVTGNVTKAEVSIPASTVGQIGSQTNASVTVSTPVADVTIPNGGLGSLSSAGGTVTVTAEQVGNSVELSVTAGGRTVQNVPGGVTLTVPAASTTPGTVAVLVHPDGAREVVRKSVADNGAVTIPLDGSAKLEIVDNSGYFADVPATSWAADAVAFASSHELFNGTAPGQFSPNLPMSRGMLAVVLHNLESNPAQALTGAFADVDNSQWYAEGVAWAEAQGIIGGYGNGRFGPNDNITREQLAVMLWRYAGSPAATDRELHFADTDRTSDWAVEALCWAVENGILNGKGGGVLDPTGQATRAEAARMLKNFMEQW